MVPFSVRNRLMILNCSTGNSIGVWFAGHAERLGLSKSRWRSERQGLDSVGFVASPLGLRGSFCELHLLFLRTQRDFEDSLCIILGRLRGSLKVLWIFCEIEVRDFVRILLLWIGISWPACLPERDASSKVWRLQGILSWFAFARELIHTLFPQILCRLELLWLPWAHIRVTMLDRMGMTEALKMDAYWEEKRESSYACTIHLRVFQHACSIRSDRDCTPSLARHLKDFLPIRKGLFKLIFICRNSASVENRLHFSTSLVEDHVSRSSFDG